MMDRNELDKINGEIAEMETLRLEMMRKAMRRRRGPVRSLMLMGAKFCAFGINLGRRVRSEEIGDSDE